MTVAYASGSERSSFAAHRLQFAEATVERGALVRLGELKLRDERASRACQNEMGGDDRGEKGAAKEVEYEGRIYAIYNVDGVISAIDGICPHQGGPLADGVIEGTTVTCPWHGWQFEIRTGKTPLGSKIRQAVYEVKIEDHDVLVAVP